MNNKKDFYIKNLGEHDGLTVWLVDGEAVRKEIDENFVQYDHHAWLHFIPTNEIWIDQESVEEERKYFIEHVQREREYLKKGMTLQKALATAAAAEAKERRATTRARRILDADHPRKEALKKIHQKKLEKYSSDDFTVWLIDGEMVRDIYLTEYAEGGHDLVYSFVPHREVWIEQILSPEEQRFIVLHELHERFLISQGKDYLSAHKGATIIEDRFRENGDTAGLEARIQEELAKNIG